MEKKPAAAAVKHIVVISLGGIGNLIFMMPAIAALERKFPDARFSFLLSKCGSSAIIRNHPKLLAYYEIEKIDWGLFKSLLTLKKMKPDFSIVATGMNPFRSGILCRFLGVRIRVGESFGNKRNYYTTTIPFNPKGHEVENNLAMATAAGGVVSEKPSFTIYTSAEDKAFAALFVNNHLPGSLKVIGLHPGSGAKMIYKRWPIERFIEVCRALLKDDGLRVLVFGGEDEIGLGDAVVAALGERVVNCAGKTTILQSFELMKYCTLLIANDTSLLHMATVAGIPVVAIYGPTSDRLVGPVGVPHRTVTYAIACRPCYQTAWKRDKTFRCSSSDQFACLRAIPVETVLHNVQDLLGEVSQRTTSPDQVK